MVISIHAPLAGRDGRARRSRRLTLISIHAPLAGRDPCLRAATRARRSDFNPRAPCGARPAAPSLPATTLAFQSTRPLRGATNITRNTKVLLSLFQSTRPLRGATCSLSHASQALVISIHAPLAGRDPSPRLLRADVSDFNPRAPCGARQQTCTKNMYMFVRTDKRNSFPCRTLSVRAPDEKL